VFNKSPLARPRLKKAERKRTLDRLISSGMIPVEVREDANHPVVRGLAMVVLGFLCSAMCHAQKPSSVSSLCQLQDAVTPGTHIEVRVSGVYGPGLDHTVLVDAGCPSVSTWVELALRSQENKGNSANCSIVRGKLVW
jgi:hypothetical protein